MSTPEQQTQSYAQGYQVGYQHGLEAARAAQNGQVPGNGGPGGSGGNGNYPFDLVGRYPESSNRLLMFFWPIRLFLLIPHMFILYVLGMAAGVVAFIAWFAVVFTGRYPEGLWNFMVGVQRWSTRVSLYAMALTDEYPPFSMN
ncbi:MAG TPA: DUF4389 domain-containing protein [Symbiobacteriaceae bacterium]|jgi:hypothetical protein|nr:DUF4389 domain-containing protein [Symbiobacteriaceae bacterium]